MRVATWAVTAAVFLGLSGAPEASPAHAFQLGGRTPDSDPLVSVTLEANTPACLDVGTLHVVLLLQLARTADDVRAVAATPAAEQDRDALRRVATAMEMEDSRDHDWTGNDIQLVFVMSRAREYGMALLKQEEPPRGSCVPFLAGATLAVRGYVFDENMFAVQNKEMTGGQMWFVPGDVVPFRWNFP